MTSENLPVETDTDKLQVQAPLGKDERRIVGLAAVEEEKSRAQFIADAAVARAVEVLTEKNPSALDGTPYAVSKSA